MFQVAFLDDQRNGLYGTGIRRVTSYAITRSKSFLKFKQLWEKITVT